MEEKEERQCSRRSIKRKGMAENEILRHRERIMEKSYGKRKTGHREGRRKEKEIQAERERLG